MEADNCTEKRISSWALVKPMSLDMDDHGALPRPRSTGLRVSAKSKAPSPPGLKTLESSDLSQWYAGGPHLTMDVKENPIDQDLSLAVVLPDGEERMTTVHGSKPLMDLLVTLCAKYHLNPSSYTLELVTTNSKNTKLKPNVLIGTLDVEKILLKPKGEDKNKKTGPQMPEATVRMVINYKRAQKTILRVSPRVPLADHLPAICEKCEFDVESTVLLRDVQSLSPLDLSCSLNDYAIREVYARDTKRQSASPVSPVSCHAVFPSKDKTQKEEENKGLFSKFRKSRKKSEQETAVSAPASPVLVSKPRPLSMALPSSNACLLGSTTVLGDVPKKRRAPPPPVVVSQGCSDISPRRRINSEPNTRLELDQVAGLSRGSSAESSLKRAKRKAPLPPTTSSPSDQETIPMKENSQGGAAANPLEEIMEQEETNVPLTAAAASDTQEEASSFSKSAEVSPPSPSPDADLPSTVAMESNGEDQCEDLPSGDKHLQNTEDESASPDEVRTEDAGASETTDTNNAPCQLENGIQEAECEEPEGVIDDCSAATCSLPPPLVQGAEAQYSLETRPDIPCEQIDETPVMPGTPCPSGEDAQEQTGVTTLSLPPQENVEEAPSLANIPAFESAEKKDIATSTGELERPDLKGVSSHTSGISSCQDPSQSPTDAVMSPSIYATNSEPKPKPSNELTRDYIPKVGMTTYTIVPQKSLEKLRYFEVALTLERPSATVEKGIDISSLSLEDSTAPRGQPDVSIEQSKLQSTSCRGDFLNSTTATPHDTVNASPPGPIHSSSSAVDGVHPGSPTEVKQVKIPPATKPKPASFRLTQHKKTPGYYVTSAVVKSLNASSGSGLRGAPERAQLPSPPRPPLLPGTSLDETSGAHIAELSPKQDKMARISRQSSLPAKPLNAGLSLEKLRSFAAPRPFCPATPSRFAQAVSSAVKRSQSLSHSPKSPCSPHSAARSPSTSPVSVTGKKGFAELKDNESTEMDGDKSCPLVAEGEGPVVMGGENPEQCLNSSDLL
ncbi:cordon-bleu protein-like 1b isoform X1 [Takifugu flavidus]|uniref:cordon-bleu protein-like 1b isoform X1 n=1 Tax=Takifugu flavidus TaxID=433684 RepID=UPI002544460E|nr:cordon-bleu protein-like 1b isoform X1 [Takifugu flavidus]